MAAGSWEITSQLHTGSFWDRRKWSEAVNPPSQPPAMYFLLQSSVFDRSHNLLLPQQCHQLGSSFQIHKSMGDNPLLSHNSILWERVTKSFWGRTQKAHLLCRVGGGSDGSFSRSSYCSCSLPCSDSFPSWKYPTVSCSASIVCLYLILWRHENQKLLLVSTKPDSN